MNDQRTKRLATSPAEKLRPAAPPALLRCYPLDGAGVPISYPLTAAVTTIGRGDDVTLHLDDDTLSRQHAKLERGAEGLVLSDCDSANGVFVNGLRIDRATLRGGELLRLGSTLLRFFAVGPTVDNAPTDGADTQSHISQGVGGPALAAIHALLDRAAKSPISVLIYGETGTGKELAALHLHRASGRSGRFIPVNCAALPRDLIESELFGHGKGAFTGAASAQLGLVRQAEGGTLFLDEIGELPVEAQAKLLRMLQERRVRPVGAAESVAVDVRLVSATNRDLGQMVVAGDFRPDLFARIGGLCVTLPPLRERPEDIPLLVAHFLRGHAAGKAMTITVDALEQLCLRRWPLNIRQLESAVQRALLLAGDEHATLDATHFPLGETDAALEALHGGPTTNKGPAADVTTSTADATAAEPAPAPPSRQAQRLREALEQYKGDADATAEALGLSRSQLYRRAKKFGLRLEDFRD